MLSALRGRLCKNIERSDTAPPIRVDSRIVDRPCAPVTPDDRESALSLVREQSLPVADGDILELPEPSITENRSRKDLLASSKEGDYVVPVEARKTKFRGSPHLRTRADRCEVWLHIYDLGPVTSRLNELILRGANLGAFHVGVEVLKTEWSFMGFYDAWDNHELSGVVRNPPCQHPTFIFRESLFMGVSAFSERDLESIILEMCQRWRANSYHWVSRNCIDFAEEFVGAVGATQPFPAYLRGASDLGKAPGVFAVADLGWTWFKNFSKRQAEKEWAELQSAAEKDLVELRSAAEQEARVAHEAKMTAGKEAFRSIIVDQRRQARRKESLAELADAQAQLVRDLERLKLTESRLQTAISAQSDQQTS